MTTTPYIEIFYLISGLILPIFYLPQIVKLYHDNSNLSSYSFSKATAQLLLRLPALAFSLFVVANPYMNLVLTLDILGRLAEWSMAVYSMKKQSFTVSEMLDRIIPDMSWVATRLKKWSSQN